MDFIHIHHTKSYAKLINLRPNLVGVRFKNISLDKEFQKSASILKTIGEYVNHTGIPVRSIFTYKTPTEQKRKVLIVEESLIYSKTTHKKLARLVKVEPFDFQLLTQVLALNNINAPQKHEEQLSMEKFLLNNKDNSIIPPSLTTRESEVLTLLLLGLSYKEIASVLSNAYHKPIRHTAVRATIHQQLFKKFHTINLQELKRYALKKVPMNCIPESLFFDDEDIINSIQLDS